MEPFISSDSRRFTRHIRCNTCAKTEEFTQDELLVLLEKNWPLCCGEVMMVVSLEKNGKSALAEASTATCQ